MVFKEQVKARSSSPAGGVIDFTLTQVALSYLFMLVMNIQHADGTTQLKGEY